MKTTTNEWPKEKINLLKILYPVLHNKDIVLHMQQAGYPTTVSAIRNAAVKYGIVKKEKWPPAAEKFLFKNWDKKSASKLAEQMTQKFKIKYTRWSVINKFRELTGKR